VCSQVFRDGGGSLGQFGNLGLGTLEISRRIVKRFNTTTTTPEKCTQGWTLNGAGNNSDDSTWI
jgi:hypothetical protein